MKLIRIHPENGTTRISACRVCGAAPFQPCKPLEESVLQLVYKESVHKVRADDSLKISTHFNLFAGSQ